MIKDDTLIEVQNLTNHTVGYTSYDGKHRIFDGQQIMKIPAAEIRQLNYSKGGVTLLHNHLAVRNRELALELGISEDVYDHEYAWTQADVVKLLSEGTEDELKDAIDFGPSGIVDMIVDTAVALKLNNIQKREIIYEMTGYNVDTMIKLVEQSKENLEETETAPRTRRAAVKEETAEKTRRA